MAQRSRIRPRKRSRPFDGVRCSQWHLAITLAALTTVVSQITGPSKCPKATGVVGYSDLFTLQRDIAITSNKTLGVNGGSYVLCPNTEFDFVTNVPVVDDDIFQIPKSSSELDPILIDASKTELICGEKGKSDDSCILLKGSFHIVIVGGVTQVQISGLTFREARNASVLYSGKGGEIAFKNCVWEENSGNTLILAVGDADAATEAPTASPMPSDTTRPTKRPTKRPTRRPTKRPTRRPTRRPTKRPDSTSPTASPMPSRATGPTISPQPTSPTTSPMPSGATGPTISPQPTSPTTSPQPSGATGPSISPEPTSPTTSPMPTGASGPTISPEPTSPTTSPVPSGISGPTSSPAPTTPTTSPKPSRISGPTSSPAPTAPTTSPNPSGISGPTSSPAPTAKTTSPNPSGISGPTSSPAPTAPTTSPNPSGISGPTSSPAPTTPTTSPKPSALSGPTSSPSPTTLTTSLKPSTQSGATSSPGPTTSQEPSGLSRPSSSLSPTSPSATSKPSDLPTSSAVPTSLTTSQKPSGVSGPSLSLLPSISFNPSVAGILSPSLSAAPSQISPSSPSPGSVTSQAPAISSSPTPLLASGAPTSFGPTFQSSNVASTSPGTSSPLIASGAPISSGPTFQSSNVVSTSPGTPPLTTALPTSPTALPAATAPPSSSVSTSIPDNTSLPTIRPGSPAPGTSTAIPTSPINDDLFTFPARKRSVDLERFIPSVLVWSRSPGTIAVAPPSPIDDDTYVFPDEMKGVNLDMEQENHSRLLQQVNSFAISLNSCTFEKNEVSLAAIFALRGELVIINCEFNDNAVDGGVVSVFQGRLEIQESNFAQNDFSVFPGPVFLDSNSRLLAANENCGRENAGGDCNGIFVQATAGDCSNPQDCVGKCNEFDSRACQTTVDCYSDWKTLSAAIKSASATQKGGKFQLCEQTVFTVDEKIDIDQPDTELYCGKEGLRSSRCIVTEGTTQFEIVGDISGILMTGITFTASSNVAIKASAQGSATLAIVDCEFSGHTGRSVIEVYNGGLGDQTELSMVPDPPGQSMTVIGVNCTFVNNVVSFSPVSDFNGVVFFDRTLFDSNTGQSGGILVLSEGQISISNCCFISSESTSLPGSVFVERGSLTLRNANNFGVATGSTNLPLDDCSDLFEETSGSCVKNSNSCDGTCQEFSSRVCTATDYNGTDTMPPSASPAPSSASPTSKKCFRKWNELSAAVREASASGLGGVFVICSNTEMNVDTFPDPDTTPIVIASDDITIQCGTSGDEKNKCVVFGGERHFQIEGSARRIKFSGISFIGALVTSIEALGDSDADVEFDGCRWEDGLGAQAILIYKGTANFPTDPDIPDSGITGTVPSMSASFRNCSFVGNSVLFAVISNVGGKLTLESCVFRGNGAPFGVLSVLGSGSVTLLENCFVSNEASTDFGLIIINENSELKKSQGNYGRSNTVGRKDNCTAILVIEADKSTCIPFDADNCLNVELPPTGAPSESPTMVEPTSAPVEKPTQGPSQGCFDDWKKLSTAVKGFSLLDMGADFILCSDTVFDVDSYPDIDTTPILLTSSDITIQCGDDGKRSNNCIVSGGVSQFEIRGATMLIQFIGVTFEKSRGMSIHAAATKDSTAFFVDCEWRNNEGTSAILMLEKKKDDTAMVVGLLRSNFTDNKLVNAAVLNIGGTLIVEETLFLRTVARQGAIQISKGGNVAISRSCFVRNSEGAVKTKDESTVIRQDTNFASRNTQCNGILNVDDDIDVLCGRACDLFDAASCSVMDFDPDLSPTASPTITFPPICFANPSKSPNSPPAQTTSLSPSDVPSDFPSMTFPPTKRPTKPSGHPSKNTNTAFPSDSPSDLPLSNAPIPEIKPTKRPIRPSPKPTIFPTPRITQSPSLRPSSRPNYTVPPTRSRIPTGIPTCADHEVPTTEPASRDPTPQTPPEDLLPSPSPTDMSLSFRYNFFYTFH